MKKLIIVAIVVILILLTPALTATMTRSYFEDQVEQVGNTPGYLVSIVDYQQGYLSSEAWIQVGIDMGSEQLQNADADGLAALQLFEQGVMFKIDISHGPVIFDPELAFGLSHYTMTFDDQQAFAQEAMTALNIDHLFKLEGTLGYFGKGTGSLTVPQFSLTEPDGQIDFGGIAVDFDSENFGATYSMNGRMEAVTVKSPAINLNIAPATIAGSGERAEQLALSPGMFEMNFPMIEFTGMDTGRMENFRIRGESSLSENNMVNAYVTYSVDNLQSTMAGMNLSDVIVDLGFENLNGDALMAISDASSNVGQLNQDPTVILNQMSKLLNDSPKIVIKKLGFTLDGVRNLDASGEFGINSDLLSQPVSFDNPMLLIGAVESQLSATVHQNLVSQLVQMMAVQQSQAAMEQMQLTPEQVGEMMQQQMEQSQMMLEQFVQQGFIGREGDNYLLDAKFQQGSLSLNGMPFQM